MYTLYSGTYFVPSFTGTPELGSVITGSYTAAATTGCFTGVLEQPVGGTIGQFRRQATAPASNFFAFGDPSFLDDTAQDFVDEGSISSFTITGLTPSSGSGNFSFTNSASHTVNGTVSITGSETVVFSGSRRVKDALHAYYMRYRSAQWYRLHGRHS
jgi:hypothetical protein